MGTMKGRGAIVAVALAFLVVGAATTGEAAYTKLYSFKNTTGSYQYSVSATTGGLEVITWSYVYPGAWAPPGLSYGVSSGVYGTQITYGGPARPPNGTVKIGWTTMDGSCRLRDLRWGGGQSIVPTQLQGVPGGGEVFYDYPAPGCLTVVITNDTDGTIPLSEVQFAIAGQALSLDELSDIMEDGGLVALRVSTIDDAIDLIYDDVAYYESLGTLPSPSANSLERKLSRAEEYKEDGLTEYLAGDEADALFAWAKAAKQIENFISEVTAATQKGNLAIELYERWVVSGSGEITPASEIQASLLALPDGQSLQTFEPLDCGALPSYAGLDPANCVQWPVNELGPGEFTAFVVCGLDLGAGFIMGGSVADSDGNVLLDWMEQSVAEPEAIDTTPPVITSAIATPAFLWPPDHVMLDVTLDVTVEDDSYAVWYIAGVTSNQPENGTGDGDYSPDWVLDPDDPQSLSLREERSGNHPEGVREYTVTLMAIDMAGNLSEPYELIIPVDHDQG